MIVDWNKIPYKTKLEYYVLTILEENKSCTWKKLKEKSFIPESSLIQTLEILTCKTHIKKNIDTQPLLYHITSKGREYHNQIVQIINKKVKFPPDILNLDPTQKVVYMLQKV